MKPAPGSYAYAARQCGVEPIDMMLVAVHPCDIDGAHRAGLGTAWINRTGATYPWTVPGSVDTGISCPEFREIPESVRHLSQLLSQ